MTQDDLKRCVAEAAAERVVQSAARGSIIGVGTGSTANFFIDALARHSEHFAATVASSEATRQRLARHGFKVLDLNAVDDMPFYVDGADEIDSQLNMVKGGGGALTREKIVAAVAGQFICIADASKQVDRLGRFPLPVEVIPMARAHVARALGKLGGTPVLRQGFVTDNGNEILDVHGLVIADPKSMECTLNQIAGVVTNGLFALRPADVLLLGTLEGVVTCASAPPLAGCDS